MEQQEFLDELNDYVGFTAEHAAVLGELGPHLSASFDGIVERFYDAIQRTPRAVAVFTGGQPQIERQKGFLRAWLEGLLGGRYDRAYLELRARIGRTHVRIRLDQRYMFGGMNLIREGLHTALTRSRFDPARMQLGHEAIDKICDLELAIMLQTYSEDYTARMRDQERLATLGQLSGFVGHELRNPLAVMETSLHLLKKRLNAPDEHTTRHLSRLTEQVELSGSIISDLLELASDRPLARADTELAALFVGAVDSLTRRYGAEIGIDIEPGLTSARLDAHQTRLLILNLLTNACQAVAECSEKRVLLTAAREGDTLRIAVDDTGPGIAEEIRYRLFEPLQSAKKGGLGLGLALCRRIAAKHDGDMRAQRSPLGGARFEARLGQAFPEGVPA